MAGDLADAAEAEDGAAPAGRGDSDHVELGDFYLCGRQRTDDASELRLFHQSAALDCAGETLPARAAARVAMVGLVYALTAYAIWGVVPLYFRALAPVPPLVVLCYRIVWSALFMGLVISIRGEWRAIWPMLRRPRTVLLLLAGAILIASNWVIFIYAVGSGQTMQASFGYFINPLLSIVLGMLFLRERLRGWQWWAVGIAGLAVANLALRGSGFPWI